MVQLSWKCRFARSRVRPGTRESLCEPHGCALATRPNNRWRNRSTRMLMVAAILLAAVLPSRAAEKLTVSELEQILAQYAAHPHDTAKQHLASDEIPDITSGDPLQQLDGEDELLAHLARIELTERLSTPRMYQLVGKYSLGSHVQLALEQLADRTALLSLPLSEHLHQVPPDAKAQKLMLEQSRAWVLGELSHLPNFVASETTTRFDNSPVMLKYFQAMTDEAGFHRVATVRRQISFQDGKEVRDASARDDANRKDSGLDSRGEFGTEAAVIWMDLVHGTVAFDHWEQSMAGPAAVYHYSVPREFSHYEVADACLDHISFHDNPAYHGEIALEPKTGAVLRMTLEAESRPNDPVSHVASVVEYGPVVLGSRRSICPLRSLTFMVEEANGCFHGTHKLQKPVAMINQTIFSNYHRFGSSATIIFDEAQNKHGAPERTPAKPASGEEKGLPVAQTPNDQNRQPD